MIEASKSGELDKVRSNRVPSMFKCPPISLSSGGFHCREEMDLWRSGGLMVSALVSGSSGPGSSPGRRHCVVFLGKTLDSHSASLHPGV